MADTTREAWLATLAHKLRPQFAAYGGTLPDQLRISSGWPARRAVSRHNRHIGECWARSASRDGTVEIFISPYLEAPLEVGCTLIHELVHAAVGVEWGHQGPFKRLALAIGLKGPMRSTHAGEVLRARLNVLITTLGPYPHARLNPMWQRHKQSTRLHKVMCQACGYTARITMRWLERGLPTCPCGTAMVHDG
jgi:hypothetical protein